MGVELANGRGYKPYHSRWYNAAILVALILGLVVAFVVGQARVHDPYSSDGRYHKCGLVTEEGVTENLDAYWARCPDERP